MRHSAFSPRSSALARPAAFTMAELLIVIALIVLLLGLAVPAFNLLSGGRSIEGATNQVSAALGRARAEAIGLQKTTGVLFFIDPRSQRRSIAIVQQVEHDTVQGVDVWLDIVDENDFLPLPAGIGVQVIDDCVVTGTAPNQARTDDGYLGFNTIATSWQPTISSVPGGDLNAVGGPTGTAVPFGGVILFDGNGQLAFARYGLRCAIQTSSGMFDYSKLGLLVLPSAGKVDLIPGPNNPTGTGVVANRSAVGMVLFEQDVFANNGGADPDPQMAVPANSGGAYAPAERNEEAWLDNNSTPLMINRYNGTLVRGE